MLDYDEIKTAVHTAALILDEQVPDWPSRINVATLDLMDGDVCIAGQVNSWRGTVWTSMPCGSVIWPDDRVLDDADYDAWGVMAQRAWLCEIAYRHAVVSEADVLAVSA